jgi:2-haloacid dehalogenase
LQAYLRAARLLGLKPSEAMMVAAHEGDLAAARTAGLHTAYVNVPEEDNTAEAFEEPDDSNFDIEARDFDGLCRTLGE